jgi:cholesterol 7-dehydrogenase
VKARTRKFGTEVPPPYPNGWYAIEASENVKKDRAKSVDMLGENFVVFRSKSNEVFVLVSSN